MLPSDDDFMHRFRTRSACLYLAPVTSPSPVAYQSRYQKLLFFSFGVHEDKFSTSLTHVPLDIITRGDMNLVN